MTNLDRDTQEQIIIGEASDSDAIKWTREHQKRLELEMLQKEAVLIQNQQRLRKIKKEYLVGLADILSLELKELIMRHGFKSEVVISDIGVEVWLTTPDNLRYGRGWRCVGDAEIDVPKVQLLALALEDTMRLLDEKQISHSNGPTSPSGTNH